MSTAQKPESALVGKAPVLWRVLVTTPTAFTPKARTTVNQRVKRPGRNMTRYVVLMALYVSKAMIKSQR